LSGFDPDGHSTARFRWIRGCAADKGKPGPATNPVIAVTSYALSGDDSKAFEAGCDGYVSKPFSPRALLAKIREFLPQPGSA
jgi:CheY-like chemotaxis protein